MQGFRRERIDNGRKGVLMVKKGGRRILKGG